MTQSNPIIPNIALITASGVNEAEMTAIQRALVAHKWKANIISPETGLVNSWAGASWGHSFAADSKIEVSLGSDFDMLIIPGGARHIEKLAANPHTKRILTALCALGKPIVAFADGKALLEGHAIEEGKAKIFDYTDASELEASIPEMMAFFEANMPVQYEEDEDEGAQQAA